MLLDIGFNSAVLVPAALARGLESVSDSDGLGVVEGFRVCLGAGVVEELHVWFVNMEAESDRSRGDREIEVESLVTKEEEGNG